MGSRRWRSTAGRNEWDDADGTQRLAGANGTMAVGTQRPADTKDARVGAFFVSGLQPAAVGDGRFLGLAA